jgi:16S rRNA (guanine527-N7)-methyltransferase
MIAALERVTGRPVPRETFERLEAYAALLRIAAAEHNLVAASTLDTLWERHILDSAQLVRFAPRADSSWVDIGSGAGLPGLVIALLVEGPVTLIEPRRLRAEFLDGAVQRLGLAARVTVAAAKADKIGGKFDLITARAVAPLGRLLGLAQHLARRDTMWVLPKGKNAKSELAETQRSWHCTVRTEASCTDPQATILVLGGVGKR